MAIAIDTQNDDASDYASLRQQCVTTIRKAIRTGAYRGHTSGLAFGRLQANLAILPASAALDFMRFCQRNPKPCPLVGVTDTGDPIMRSLGEIDIRTDLPGYNVYRDGALIESRTDISDLWRDDLIAFALGCSFTFERALTDAGIFLDHIDRNLTVPMYRTNLQTRQAGPFGSGMVVSMRMLPTERVEEAIEISRAYPWAHGAPVHVGAPDAIGITDLSRPDWGDPPAVLDNRTPVFWACGVTPQNAVLSAKLPFCITHKPGHMLITDVDEFADTPFIDNNLTGETS